MILRACLILVIGVLAYGARAADITATAMRDGVTAIILTGPIQPEDGARFATAASGTGHAVVVFASPGGNLLAGLRIGQFIRLHEFATLVPDGAHCASACALAWLGGTRRMMQPTGQVGFHAAYIRDADGSTHETGAGNALVCAYLSRLGLEDEAILYIERAAPNDITWLQERDARRLGIDVSIVPSFEHPKDAPRLDSSTPPSKPARDMRAAAVSFAGTYFAHWSESNADALGYFRSVYASRVDFYGQAIPLAVVLDQKARFAERWPERLYAVRADTVHAECAAGACDVTGVVDWDARNADRDQRSAGSAEFRLQIGFHADKPSITAESGTVLSRDGDKPAVPTKERTSDAKASD